MSPALRWLLRVLQGAEGCLLLPPSKTGNILWVVLAMLLESAGTVPGKCSLQKHHGGIKPPGWSVVWWPTVLLSLLALIPSPQTWLYLVQGSAG